MARQAERPSITGILTSIRMISKLPGSRFLKTSSPLLPSAAQTTSAAPICSSSMVASSPLISLSSQSRMRRPARVGPFPSEALGAASSGGVHSSRSTVRVMVVPFPNWLSTSMEAPIRSRMFFTMARPRPVPRIFSVPCWCSWLNGSNMRCWNSSLMPSPVSLTMLCRRQRPGGILSPSIKRDSQRTVPPSGVYLMALERRFRATCSMRVWSAITHSLFESISSAHTASKCSPFWAAWEERAADICSKCSFRQVGWGCSSIMPTSILDISSTSFTRERISSAE